MVPAAAAGPHSALRTALSCFARAAIAGVAVICRIARASAAGVSLRYGPVPPRRRAVRGDAPVGLVEADRDGRAWQPRQDGPVQSLGPRPKSSRCSAGRIVPVSSSRPLRPQEA